MRVRREQPHHGHRVDGFASGAGLAVGQQADLVALDAAHVAHIESLRRNSPLGELLAAALDVRNRPRDQIRERIEDTGRHVLHDLERFLPTLGTIAAVTPLLGLLGTVFGMIAMFMGILEAGVGDANRLAGGIGQALISTAAGLLVAIPALVMHRWFRARVAGFVVEMEKEAIALVDAIDEHAVSGKAKGKGAAA